MTAELILTPLGQPGSGRLRYGAAMALYTEGQLSAGGLEAYRIASSNDFTDPATLLAEWRVMAPIIPEPVAAGSLIRSLIAEADRYLATLSGPGIAEVRADIARWSGGPLQRAGRTHPVVTAHLDAALDQLQTTYPALAGMIAAAAPHLPWGTYDLCGPAVIGDAFRTGHAFCSLITDEAVIPERDFDLGLLLIAPHVVYREHCHAAPELYAPLTGPHGWRFKPDAPLVLKQAHKPVWNDPIGSVLTKVGPTPFLGLVCWTKDVQVSSQTKAP